MFKFTPSTVALVLAVALTPAAAQEADPMRPPQTAPETTAKPAPRYYHLSSILISPERRSAIINGRRVSVGERVGGARVVTILGSEVTLSIAGRHKTLTLLPLSIKKPAEAPRQ